MTEIHITPRQLATRWAVSEGTLQLWRTKNTGPGFTRFGRKILYPLSEVTRCETTK